MLLQNKHTHTAKRSGRETRSCCFHFAAGKVTQSGGCCNGGGSGRFCARFSAACRCLSPFRTSLVSELLRSCRPKRQAYFGPIMMMIIEIIIIIPFCFQYKLRATKVGCAVCTRAKSTPLCARFQRIKLANLQVCSPVVSQIVCEREKEAGQWERILFHTLSPVSSFISSPLLNDAHLWIHF